MNAAGRPLGVLQPAAAAAHRLGDRPDRFLLADHPPVQFLLHLHQPEAVFRGEPRERDAGHLGDDFGDHFLVHHAVGLAGLFAPVARDLLFLLLQFVGLIAQGGRLLEILVGDGLFLFLVQPLDVVVDFLQVRRSRHGAESHAGPGFVDDVDGLVGQAAGR